MGLFRKKREVRELKLPEAPLAFPELPQERGQKEGLPQLPSLPALKPISTLPQLEPVETQIPKMPMHPKLMPTPQMSIPKLEISKVREPIFIKIDKFRDAMANFELVKKKLNETSSLLDQIREARAKEEDELSEWSEELNLIKQKISSIDKKIFSSLD